MRMTLTIGIHCSMTTLRYPFRNGAALLPLLVWLAAIGCNTHAQEVSTPATYNEFVRQARKDRVAKPPKTAAALRDYMARYILPSWQIVGLHNLMADIYFTNLK